MNQNSALFTVSCCVHVDCKKRQFEMYIFASNMSWTKKHYQWPPHSHTVFTEGLCVYSVHTFSTGYVIHDLYTCYMYSSKEYDGVT